MIRLIAVGKVKEKYLKEGISDFLDRISHYTKIEVIEVKDQGVEKEGEKILDLIKGFSIALVIEGKEMGSIEFSKVLKNQPTITFIIGGPEGLSRKVIEKANLKLSLSKMTFLHEMSQLILLEQIYRSHTILKGTSYHK